MPSRPLPAPLLWIPRLLLLAVFVTHGFGKITAFQAFQEKFVLPTPIVVLLIMAELGGAVGVVTGGLLPGRLGLYATYAGCFTIAVSQVGAIAYARWPQWFEQYSGMEYNVVLLGLCLLLALGHRAVRRAEHGRAFFARHRLAEEHDGDV